MEFNESAPHRQSVINMNVEIWKDIPGFEGSYQISNFGRVKSLPKVWVCGNRGSLRRKGETILKLSFNHAAKKGRMFKAVGEDHPMCKISKEDVIAIRGMADEYTHLEISKRFSIGRRTVCSIINRKIWKHV